MRPGASPEEKFDGWFTKAIAKLEELPEGDGGFAAMMIGLPLYERYIKTKLELDGKEGKKAFNQAVQIDLGLTTHDRYAFWNVFRNGLLHGAMPKSDPTKWILSHEFGEKPIFTTAGGITFISLDPWKFTKRVIRLFVENPQLMTALQKFPFPDVILGEKADPK